MHTTNDSTLTPGSSVSLPGRPTPPAGALTVFRNANGRPLTKTARLDPGGQLLLTPAAELKRGEFRVVSAPSIDQLAALIKGLTTSEALAWGIERTGLLQGEVTTALKLAAMNGSARPTTVARTQDHFVWAACPGWLMLDFDLKGIPEPLQRKLGPLSLHRPREVLLEVAPGLAEMPMLALPSASAFLYRTRGQVQLHGLTGARFYLPVARASEIPNLGKRLHERLVLAGYGFAFISKAGTMDLRSLIDKAVWRPAGLDFIAGAHCEPGIEQRRGDPQTWHADSLLMLDDAVLPPLTGAEQAQLSEIEDALRAEAAAEGLRVRTAWIEKQRAAGHTVAISWTASGEVQHLDGPHAIMLADGTWVTVDEIVNDPDRFHNNPCADPLEPESYGGDYRIAKIYSQQSTPAIHSFAHGGATYLLRQSAQAAFEADPDLVPPAEIVAPAITTLPTEGERIAAITGHPVRSLFLEAGALPDGELASRRRALQAAASIGDPLTSLFDAEVIPAAGSLAAGDRDHFAARLRAALDGRGHAGWHNASSEARQLLIRAAFAFFAPIGTLMRSGARGHVPLVDLYAEAEPRRWLVEGLIPSPGVAALVGAPGSGKTFIANDLVSRVATAPVEGKPLEFMDCPVAHGAVLYFASEDAIGVRDRLRAWANAYSDPRANLQLIARALPLSAPEDALEILTSGLATLPADVPLRLVVVDVFRDSLAGDENSSEVSGAAMATAHLISRLTGASVLLIHHASRQTPTAARGSTAFDGACDMMASVERRDSGMLLTVTKHRNGAPGRRATWHVRDGVLRCGRTPGGDANGRTVEETAAMIARSLHGIALPGQPATRRDLAAVLAADYPAVFGQDLSHGTVSPRLTRGLRFAVERGWVVPKGTKYLPGAEPPPELVDLSAMPPDLAEVHS